MVSYSISSSEAGEQSKAESGDDVFLKLPGGPVIELLGRRGLSSWGEGKRSVGAVDVGLVVSKIPRRSREYCPSKTGVGGKAF